MSVRSISATTSKSKPRNRYQRFIATRQRIKLAIFLKMLRSKVMASFAHFVGVRRSCRALQFILTATEAAIATQKPNGKPVSALTSTRQASFCQHGRSLPSPPEISAFYSRLNHTYMHPLTCVKYGAAALALGPALIVTIAIYTDHQLSKEHSMPLANTHK